MDREQLLEISDRLIEKAAIMAAKDRALPLGDYVDGSGMKAEASEFLRNYGGPHNAFHEQVSEVDVFGGAEQMELILTSFRDYVAEGLLAEISPERRAQLDVVSDLMGQAEMMLDSPKVHPAAPAMVVGATLEEFLRTWCDASGLELGGKKPGIQSFADLLRETNHISKQDAQDITSWGGIRNDAAHGSWDKVEDPKRVRIMLEGVNLFMRTYGG